MANTPSAIVSLFLFAALGASAPACGGADDTALAQAPGAAAPGPDPVAPDPAPEVPAATPADAALMVMNRICTPEGCNHYMYFMRELPADGMLDRSQGIELGDTQASIHAGSAYVFDRLNPSITRWTVGADLVPQARETIP